MTNNETKDVECDLIGLLKLNRAETELKREPTD